MTVLYEVRDGDTVLAGDIRELSTAFAVAREAGRGDVWEISEDGGETNVTAGMLERERVEVVFRLTGGELHDRHPKFPDEWDDVFAYWYEGTPEYAEDLDDTDCRTAVVDCLYGFPDVPEGWEQVAAFSSSGETQCLCEGGEPECPLCEGDGTVYLGDGWHEVVYRRVEKSEEPECVVCPACGGAGLFLLGKLGNRNHFRCRNCAAECSMEVGL